MRARTGTHTHDIRGCVCNAYLCTFLRFACALRVARCEHRCVGGALVQSKCARQYIGAEELTTYPIPITFQQ